MSQYPKKIHVGGIDQLVKNAMEETFWRGGPTVQEATQQAVDGTEPVPEIAHEAVVDVPDVPVESPDESVVLTELKPKKRAVHAAKAAPVKGHQKHK